MGRDVYRTSTRTSSGAASRELLDELLVPLLALALGALLLVTSLAGETPRPTEGGLGTVAVLFGIYAFKAALRALPRGMRVRATAAEPATPIERAER